MFQRICESHNIFCIQSILMVPKMELGIWLFVIGFVRFRFA